MSTTIWWHHLMWILFAGGVGFTVAALFADRLKLPRRLFLIPYVGVSSLFVAIYLQWSGIEVGALLAENWLWGLLAGTLIGTFLVANVRSQPASRQSAGGSLVLDLAWLGLAYGLVDGLLLNVMPVLAVRQAMPPFSWASTAGGEIAVGVLALLASLLVTFGYHAGYAEFRNRSMGLVLVGNGLITLAFVVSGSPLAAIQGHVVMHLAAVLRGPETTVQLPPHLPSAG